MMDDVRCKMYDVRCKKGPPLFNGLYTPFAPTVANGDLQPFVGSEPHSVPPLKTPVVPSYRGTETPEGEDFHPDGILKILIILR